MQAIPLFVTSTAIPLLLVCFRVIRDAETEEPLSPPDATKYALFRKINTWESCLTRAQMGFLYDVLSDDHATHWWLHYCRCVVKDQHRPCVDYQGTKLCWYEAKCCVAGCYGSSLLRQYVDQVCK